MNWKWLGWGIALALVLGGGTTIALVGWYPTWRTNRLIEEDIQAMLREDYSSSSEIERALAVQVRRLRWYAELGRPLSEADLQTLIRGLQYREEPFIQYDAINALEDLHTPQPIARQATSILADYLTTLPPKDLYQPGVWVIAALALARRVQRGDPLDPNHPCLEAMRRFMADPTIDQYRGWGGGKGHDQWWVGKAYRMIQATLASRRGER